MVKQEEVRQALAPIQPKVESVYASFPLKAQKVLRQIRQFVLDEAERLGVGHIEETLRWGEPAYLTSESKAGSTIRLGWKKDRPELVSIFFNCKTNLVEEARAQFPHAFEYVGNRALSLRIDQVIPELPTRACLSMALTYHRGK